MKSDRNGPAAVPGWSSYKWTAIAVVLVAAAGLAYQLQGQPRVIAEAGSAGQAQPGAGTPPPRGAVADEARSERPQQIASKDPEYCPAGEPGYGKGSGNTLCSLFRGGAASDDAGGTNVLGRIGAAVMTGASKVAPVVQNFAQHCLAYLK